MHSDCEGEGGTPENSPEVEDEVIVHSHENNPEDEDEVIVHSHENPQDEDEVIFDSPDADFALAIPYSHHLLVRPSCWSSGIFGCSEVCSICCVTIFCPCITFGRVAEVADQGRWRWSVYSSIYCLLSLVGVQWLYSFMFRKKLRAIYSLAEHPCNDCCMHCWCGRCALCQEAREIKYRAGWVEPAMAPPVAQEMTMKNGSTDMPAAHYRVENFSAGNHVKFQRCGLFRFFLKKS